jgi:hypothetical protein
LAEAKNALAQAKEELSRAEDRLSKAEARLSDAKSRVGSSKSRVHSLLDSAQSEQSKSEDIQVSTSSTRHAPRASQYQSKWDSEADFYRGIVGQLEDALAELNEAAARTPTSPAGRERSFRQPSGCASTTAAGYHGLPALPGYARGSYLSSHMDLPGRPNPLWRDSYLARLQPIDPLHGTGFTTYGLNSVVGRGLTADGRLSRGDWADILSRETGRGYENTYMDLHRFDSASPLSGSVGHGMWVDGRPSRSEMADILTRNTGTSFENAYMQLGQMAPPPIISSSSFGGYGGGLSSLRGGLFSGSGGFGGGGYSSFSNFGGGSCGIGF